MFKLVVQTQHGDVILEKTHMTADLKAALEKAKTVRSVTLAEGEVTGHSHVLTAERFDVQLRERVPAEVEVFDFGAISYLYVPEDVIATVVHEEHLPVQVDHGLYINKGVMETVDPLRNLTQRVRD